MSGSNQPARRLPLWLLAIGIGCALVLLIGVIVALVTTLGRNDEETIVEAPIVGRVPANQQYAGKVQGALSGFASRCLNPVEP